MGIRRTSVALLLGAALLSAPPAPAETLSDTLVEAVLASPDLERARADLKVLTERAIQARARGRVQVEGTVDVGGRYVLDDLGDPISYPTTLALTATQPLYTGGQVANATEAALIRMAAQRARIGDTEQVVLLDTVTGYMDVLRDRQLIDVVAEQVENLEFQLFAARRRFEVGEGSGTDISQAEARLAAARGLLAAREGALATSREVFRRAVGRYPDDLQPPPPVPDLPDDLEHAVVIALTENPAVRAARLERLAAGSDVRAAIGALLPQLALVAQVSRDDPGRIRGDDRTDMRVGLQLVLPFYSGGQQYSRVRGAQAFVEEREAEIAAALRETVQRVGTAWANLEASRVAIESGIVEVASARFAVEGVRSEVEVGARSTIDVLNAEEELLDARAALIESRRDAYVAAFQLLFSIGKLSIVHLGLEMTALDPVADYYDGVRARDFGFDPTADTVWTVTYQP